MSQNFIIPQNEQQLSDASKLTIKTLGLGLVKTVLYNIPREDKDIPFLTPSKMLGTSVFSNLRIAGRSYTDIEGKEGKFPDIVLETVLFNVSQQKNIVITPVQGRNTTVKEFISNGDYAITIKGLITGPNGIFPRVAMADFISMQNAPISIDVSSWFLQLFGIYNIVILSCEFQEVEGMYSTQQFEIQAYSDQPIELYISQ